MNDHACEQLVRSWKVIPEEEWALRSHERWFIPFVDAALQLKNEIHTHAQEQQKQTQIHHADLVSKPDACLLTHSYDIDKMVMSFVDLADPRTSSAIMQVNSHMHSMVRMQLSRSCAVSYTHSLL